MYKPVTFIDELLNIIYEHVIFIDNYFKIIN